MVLHRPVELAAVTGQVKSSRPGSLRALASLLPLFRASRSHSDQLQPRDDFSRLLCFQRIAFVFKWAAAARPLLWLRKSRVQIPSPTPTLSSKKKFHYHSASIGDP